MFTPLIIQRMTESADGRFTYAPAQSSPPEELAEIYNSSPVYFGLVGKVIGINQDGVLDMPSRKEPEPDKKNYIVIKQLGEPVALLNCILDFPDDGIVLLGWLMVHGGHLFQGIGRANYQIFCNAMRSINMKEIRILIETYNEGAMTFWRSLGFQPIPSSAKKSISAAHLAVEHAYDLENFKPKPLDSTLPAVHIF